MEELYDLIGQTLGINRSNLEKISVSLLVIFALVILRLFLERVVVYRVTNPHHRYRLQKSITYMIFFIGLLVIGIIWIDAGEALITYFGLVSAALVVALQDPITNLVGWGFINWRKPFEVGDRIQIGDNQGDVVDIRVFQFSMMEIGNWVGADQSTGRIIHIPNRTVFSSAVANYTKGSDYIWNEIPVLITFESDWQKAKSILQAVAVRHAMQIDDEVEASFRKAAKKYFLKYGKLEPVTYTSVKDSGVLLTIRYLHEPRKRRDSEQSIWESILVEFGKHDNIDFAYPTQRYYNHFNEGSQNLFNSE